ARPLSATPDTRPLGATQPPRATPPARRAPITPPPTPRRLPLDVDKRSGRENTVVPTVLARRVHHPLHALGIRARRQLARGRQDESRALSGGVDAALHFRLDLRLGRALEDRHVDVADRDHVPLIAERDQAVELVNLERRIALLIEVDRDRDEADVDQILVDLMRGAADVHGRADLLRPEV